MSECGAGNCLSGIFDRLNDRKNNSLPTVYGCVCACVGSKFMQDNSRWRGFAKLTACLLYPLQATFFNNDYSLAYGIGCGGGTYSRSRILTQKRFNFLAKGGGLASLHAHLKMASYKSHQFQVLSPRVENENSDLITEKKSFVATSRLSEAKRKKRNSKWGGKNRIFCTTVANWGSEVYRKWVTGRITSAGSRRLHLPPASRTGVQKPCDCPRHI